MRTAVLTISTSVSRRDERGRVRARCWRELAEEAGCDVDADGGRPRRLRAHRGPPAPLRRRRLRARSSPPAARASRPTTSRRRRRARSSSARRPASPRRCAPSRCAHTPMGDAQRGVAGIARPHADRQLPRQPEGASSELFGVLAPVLAHAVADAAPRAMARRAAIELEGLARRYGERAALDDVSLTLAPRGDARRLRPQRRGQDDAAARPRHAAAPARRHASRVLGERAARARAGRSAAGSASSATSRCCTATSAARENLRFHARLHGVAGRRASSELLDARRPRPARRRPAAHLLARDGPARRGLPRRPARPRAAAARRAAREPRPGAPPSSSSR